MRKILLFISLLVSLSVNAQIDGYWGGYNNSSSIYGNTCNAMSFNNSGGEKLITNVTWSLKKTGSPTGSMYVKLYAHTGTYGSTGKPTGAVLATSDAFDVSTVATNAYYDYWFYFTGSSQYRMSTATKYEVAIFYSGGDASNYINCSLKYPGTSFAGNRANSYDGGSSWTPDADRDYQFAVYGVTPPATRNVLFFGTEF